MTKEEFIEELDKKGYSYEIEGDKVVVNGGDGLGHIYLDTLTTIPSGVEFRNKGYIILNALTSIPSGVEFNNPSEISLTELLGGRFKLLGWTHTWKGNIEGITSRRLFNVMIKKGMFV